MIYFDNAATGFPKGKSVMLAVSQAMRQCGNPGRSEHLYSVYASEILYSAREELANLFHTSSEKVVLCPSATYALNIAIKGLYKGVGKILVSDLEHNSVIRPSVSTAETIFFNVDIEDDLTTIENFRKKIDDDVTLVVITHASNVCGRILPVENLASICNEYNVPVIVDASQTAGYIPFNMSQSQVDVMCIPGHKGLYGPMGTGALIVNPQKNPCFNTLIQGGTGILSHNENMPDDLPERLEAGTCGVHDFAGLKEAVKKCTFDMNSLMQKFFYLVEELKKIKEIKIYGFSEINLDKYVPIILLNMEGVVPQELSKLLYNKKICVRSGFHCAPIAHKKLDTGHHGAVRLSIGKKNSFKECERLIQAMKEIAKR